MRHDFPKSGGGHSCRIITGLLICLVVFLPGTVVAKIKDGIACSQCHTMHYSQDDEILAGWGTGGPYAALLTEDCLGCHTGTNTSTSVSDGSAPYVLTTAGVAYNNTGTESSSRNTLAGGNFSWVVLGDDAKGHNLAGNPGLDSRFSTIPGSATAYNTPLTCAGADGCHGNRSIASEVGAMKGAHHDDGGSLAASYRFLSGIAGLEDTDWEFTAASDDHNQYKGGTGGSGDASTDTITAFCKACHGTFHSGAGGGSPWLRHPTDIDLADASYNGTEFDSYTTYDPVAPVASSSAASVIDNTVQTAGNGIVTCISCHRSHGTPYNGLLRWDYQNWPTGGYDGCGICHTDKN